jgi:hypothetical protein
VSYQQNLREAVRVARLARYERDGAPAPQRKWRTLANGTFRARTNLNHW